MSKSPSDIIKRIQEGNEHAFKCLFDEMYPALCVFATNFINDDDEAADIVQECFINYWKKRKDFDNMYQLRSFLYISVRNACLNSLRHDKTRNAAHSYLFEEEYFHDNLLEEEAIRIFYQAVNQLSGQSHKVILLSLEGLKNDQIASEMNISINTVHMFKKMAYKKLRELLKEYFYLLFIFLGKF